MFATFHHLPVVYFGTEGTWRLLNLCHYHPNIRYTLLLYILSNILFGSESCGSLRTLWLQNCWYSIPSQKCCHCPFGVFLIGTLVHDWIEGLSTHSWVNRKIYHIFCPHCTNLLTPFPVSTLTLSYCKIKWSKLCMCNAFGGILQLCHNHHPFL